MGTQGISRKKYALIPAERKKPCTHTMRAYRGRVPCTGPVVCLMCGQYMGNRLDT